jgi:hypothetical protein
MEQETTTMGQNFLNSKFQAPHFPRQADREPGCEAPFPEITLKLYSNTASTSPQDQAILCKKHLSPTKERYLRGAHAIYVNYEGTLGLTQPSKSSFYPSKTLSPPRFRSCSTRDSGTSLASIPTMTTSENVALCLHSLLQPAGA